MTGKLDVDFSVSIHRGVSGLDELEHDWRALTLGDRRYWIQFAFFRQLVVHSLTGSEELELLAVRDAFSRVVSILPLRSSRIPIRRVTFRGLELFGSTVDAVSCQASSADFPSDPNVPLHGIIDAALSSLTSRVNSPTLLSFGRMTTESRMLKSELAMPTYRVFRSSGGGHKWLDVDRTFDRVRAELSGKFKISLRSSRRKLSELGSLEWRMSSPTQASFASDFEAFLQIESSGWKGSERTGLLVDPVQNQRAFLESIARGASESFGSPEIHTLRVDGKPIAAQLWLRADHTRVAFKVGYRPDWARFQPGHLLIEHIVQLSCDDPQIRTIDFVSDADWLDKWRVSHTQHFHQYIILRGLSGSLAGLLLRLPTRRVLVERLRAFSATVRVGDNSYSK